jgi:peptide/nickel transport system permease protein
MTVSTAAAVSTEPLAQDHLFRKLLRNPLAVASMCVLAISVIVAILSPWITPFPPNQVILNLTNAAPLQTKYFLGGDGFGRDILSRLIASTRGSLEAAVVLTVVSAALGITSGLLAGYFGRVFDAIGSWVFAVLMAAPAVIILIALYTVVGTSPNVAMAILGVLVSPAFFWLVRTLTRTVRSELYVDAARVSGLSNARIVGRHVFMAIRAPVIIMAAFLAGAAISLQAGLQFLGLGDPDVPSWGGMLTDAFNNIYIAPVQLVWPGLALGIVVAAFVLLGNALRDALQGSDLKRSARSRRKEIQSLLGTAAAEKTLRFQSAEERKELALDSGESDDAPLLEIQGLQIAYSANRKLMTVVEGISLTVDQGEVLGLVGESGSGKTQTVFAALGLLPDEAIIARGSIRLNGRELLGLPEKQLSALRGTQIAYVPQEPMSNLDPSFKVGAQLVYGIRAQSDLSARAAKELALSMLERVGINDPARTFRSYPHEISGGMAQRVLIAGAIACQPRLLIADEPTTALDVTVQAEVLDLLRDLQKERNMGVLIVTHNFGVVADLCDRVAVMRTGKIVEEGSVKDVFARPQHEYTKMLLGSILDDAELRRPLSTTNKQSAHV